MVGAIWGSPLGGSHFGGSYGVFPIGRPKAFPTGKGRKKTVPAHVTAFALPPHHVTPPIPTPT